MTPGAPALDATLSALVRQDRGRLLSALIAHLGDFDLAEEALSDALESALVHWGRAGLPRDPRAWLLQVARRKAIDRIRRRARWRDRAGDLFRLAEADEAAGVADAPEIPDERLRLIFTCCHPALDPASQVALTLRTLGGLTTEEIARAFLVAGPTMGQRIARAKARIAATGIPFAVPGPEDWARRLASVLKVIYLVFNEGYSATAGDAQIRLDLCEEALWLARLVAELSGGDAEALGLLSLVLTSHARQPARGDADDALIVLAEQDRGLWDRDMIGNGLAALDRALAAGMPGPFQIKAAISALHVQAPDPGSTDWRQILLLYNELLRYEPSDVVRLNRAVALAEAGTLDLALVAIADLAEALDEYQPFHAARAALLARAGDPSADAAFACAIALSGTAAQRVYLARKRAEYASKPMFRQA